MGLPKVSIVVPFKNVIHYIEECALSLVNQDYENTELIFVNDFSDDGSLEKLEGFSKQYQQIKIINNTEGGANNARQRGFLLTKGEYLLFVDSDDTLKMNAVSFMVNIAESNGVDLVASNLIRVISREGRREEKSFFEFKKTDKVLKLEDSSIEVFKDMSSNIVAKLVKRSLLEGIIFANLPYAQDWNITFQFLPKVETVYFTNAGLYYYWYREGSTSDFSKNDSVENLMKVEKSFVRVLETYNEYKIPCLNSCAKFLRIKLSLGLLKRCLYLNDEYEIDDYRKKLWKRLSSTFSYAELLNFWPFWKLVVIRLYFSSKVFFKLINKVGI